MNIDPIFFFPKFLNNLNFLANFELFEIIDPPCPIVINLGILNEKMLQSLHFLHVYYYNNYLLRVLESSINLIFFITYFFNFLNLTNSTIHLCKNYSFSFFCNFFLKSFGHMQRSLLDISTSFSFNPAI